MAGPILNLVLLRGLVREARHWSHFPEEAQKELGHGVRLHLLDLPGIGTKKRQKSPMSIAGIAGNLRQDYLQLVNAPENLGAPWAICALSLGAMAALRWVFSHPRDFVHMSLVNASVAGVSPIYKRMLPRAIPQILKNAYLKGEQKEANIISLTINSPELWEKLPSQWARFSLHPARLRDLALRQLAAAISFRMPCGEDGSKKSPIPGLVMSSTADRLVHWHCSRDLAKILELPLELHNTAGHDLGLDDPQWLCQKLKESWKQIGINL